MQMSRRQFNRGAMMLSGAAAMPPVPVSMKRGSDDAYETILGEYIRVEEAARKAGMAQSPGGAVSITGKHLENFISHLDMQVNPLESSAQVFRELRGFVKEHTRQAADKATQKAEDLIEAVEEDLQAAAMDDAGEHSLAETTDATDQSA